MFGLVTMLLSTLGATGMGSMLKIVGGIFQSINEQRAAKAQRELARDLAMTKSNVELQNALFGPANEETSKYTRATRRLIALIGMLNFAIISILCTLYPTIEIITFTPPEQKKAMDILWGLFHRPYGNSDTLAITTGHIALTSVSILGAIIGFYFTPGGSK